MKYVYAAALCFCVLLLNVSCAPDQKHSSLWLGAFLADQPSAQDIRGFQNAFGKRPYWILIFTAWNHFIEPPVIDAVYSQDAFLMITWEPWNPESKEGIDFTALIQGEHDAYIKSFAQNLKSIGKPVFLRFAHETNGNWYPWASSKIGSEKYVAAYRYVKDLFDQLNVKNVKWVFAINWENVPTQAPDWKAAYPGDDYVDYIGIDGYNWGTTQSWSRWMSFSEIFSHRIQEAAAYRSKPIIISEMASASLGGDRALWIRQAFQEIRRRPGIKGIVFFNVNKEADWSLHPQNLDGQELKKQLAGQDVCCE